MKPHELDLLLGELSGQKPTLPAGFREEVWRTIRHRRAVPSSPSLFDWLLGPWLGREPVLAALGLALMLGLLFGGAAPRPDAPASDAMNLAVFSARAAGMPGAWQSR